MADRVVRSPHSNGSSNGTAPHPSGNGNAPPAAEGLPPDGLPRVRIRRVRRVSGPFTAIPQLRREGLSS